jgi:hypothetical protein
MEISRKFFPRILADNEEIYFQNLIGVIESVDELSSLEITKMPDSYRFRLAPSLPKYSPMLLHEILKINNVFRQKVILSKSIKTSGTIAFTIFI